MKQALTWAAGGTLFLFAMTTLGAATVFLCVREPRERLRRWLLGFAAGIMTAASVWSLLLPAMDRAAALGLPPWLPAAAGTGAGALFLWGLDALLPRLRPASGRTSRETALLVTAITLHNIPEGMAVGLSFALAAGGEGFAAAAALALGVGLIGHLGIVGHLSHQDLLLLVQDFLGDAALIPEAGIQGGDLHGDVLADGGGVDAALHG